MKQAPQGNGELAHSFPKRLMDDVKGAIAALPANPYWFNTFQAQVEGEYVRIPYRMYHNESLISTEKLAPLQQELLHCLLTRHHDGLIRQHYLERIIKSGHRWVPPFVVQLSGEYVIEILRVIEENLAHLDRQVYTNFLKSNRQLLELAEQRVSSYWDCYYRMVKKQEYPGFRVIQFFKELVKEAN